MVTKNDARNKFSKNLKFYMEREQKTQANISRDLGFASSLVSEWVSGKKYPRIERMKKLANYLNVSLSELVNDSDEEQLYTSLLHNTNIFAINDNANNYHSITQDTFLFRVENDYMQPKLEKNDIVVAKKKTSYPQNCLIIANHDGRLAVYLYNHKDNAVETIKTKKVYSIKDEKITVVAQVMELHRKL